MATVYYSKGEDDKALEYYNKDLVITLATLGADHPSTAGTYNNMGAVYNNKGEYDKALEYYNKALEIRLATLGADHPNTKLVQENVAKIMDSKPSLETVHVKEHEPSAKCSFCCVKLW